MQRVGLDAALFMSAANIRYLSGFSGSDGALIVTLYSVFFLTDSRYVIQAQQQVTADSVVEYSNKVAAIAECLQSAKALNVGFEQNITNVAMYNSLKSSCDKLQFRAIDDEINGLRQVKDVDEVGCLEDVAKLNSRAFAEVLPLIKAGVCEREISLALEFALKKLGGEDNSFDFIVASGVRGALPHGVASNKKLQTGELVTIDFGTRKNGYCSDETITLALGNVPQQLHKIYDTVLHAHDLAIDALEVSMPASEIDRVARAYIADQGFGEYFGHGLGHGVGLDIHELPTLSPKSEAILEAGMVFTIEPGIYVPGVGGVRIEDTVALTVDGCRCLTQCPKQYQIIE